MDNIISRHRNLSFLAAVLCAQVVGLGIQIRRPSENTSTRLIRVWAIDAIAPFEKGVVHLQGGISNLWHGYFYLRGVRQENRDLKAQIERMQLEQVRLKNDADQARRLQLLLGFKEQFISQTVAAQVIGSGGSERSRIIIIDKGSNDHIRGGMPVVTADGVVGKVLQVFASTAQVLLIDDQSSGVGTILETSRLQGVLKGTADGEIILDKVMNDEQVQPGERVLTSGGDEIFPKGLMIGTVAAASHGPESFLSIKVKPAADLNRLEEILIITENEEKQPSIAPANARAIDILAQRLPSVPDKPVSATAENSKDSPSAPSAPAARKDTARPEAKPAPDEASSPGRAVPNEQPASTQPPSTHPASTSPPSTSPPSTQAVPQ